MATIFLGLGSNMGDRHGYLRAAVSALKARGIAVRKISSVIETDPVGGPSQGKFLNAVLKAETSLSPDEILDAVQSIEYALGRVRQVVHGPRVIDIDLLLYDDIKYVSRRLVVPHPRMMERDFVLRPLREIAPRLLD